jgi:folate-binding protein YgfZ
MDDGKSARIHVVRPRNLRKNRLMTQTWRTAELDDLGVLRVHGTDALAFLQGQLSNDVTRLAAGSALLAGLHNPQGRVVALLHLLQPAPAELLAVLPRELLPPVLQRLQRYVLRAKVQLADDSARWRLLGLIADDDTLGAPRAEWGADWSIPLPGTPARLLLAVRSGSDVAVPTPDADARRLFCLKDIACGRAQVFARTSEAFVAQMLNLDVLGAIDFAKGCYTGQEVIARAHYRGRVKRRMQRFRTLAPVRLLPGDDGRLTDGRAFKVVQAAQLEDGRCEFLAVAAIDSAPTAEESPEGSASSAPAVAVATLPLPYALPP